MSRMTVNERPVEFDLDPRMPLLYALREAMNLTGTKACGGGGAECSGACMVLVDGVALRSCAITLAEAEGRLITTIEGLSRDRSHPVQQAMAAQQAVQCGYCTPGIVIAAAALLLRNPAPTREDIDAGIPNICRCGVYPRLLKAVEQAARIARREEQVSALPAPAITPEDAAKAVPALRVTAPE
jgi:isoquinoline 1-oxidoreductase alpha subunit